MNDETALESLIEQITDEFLSRYRQGERPVVEEYEQRYPEHAERLRRVLGAVLVIEGVGPNDESPAGDAAAATAPAVDRLGDYLILREVGRGGMGVVFEAEQESLGRRVALKVLTDPMHIDPRRLQRFHREARAVAMLHHSNIVPVFAVGEQDGLAFYAMQFIHGLGIDQVLSELTRLRSSPSIKPDSNSRSQMATDLIDSLTTEINDECPAGESSDDLNAIPPFVDSKPSLAESSISSSDVHLPGQPRSIDASDSGATYWLSVARMGVQVANALEYAHSRGVLHRDIKPSNLLLDTEGTVWITDFGLAKSSDEVDLTKTGELVGTLRYIPPEQFSGKSDARSDLYSLGLTLYELLTLRPAFGGNSREQLIHEVTAGVPTAPRRLNPSIPRDLETITLKAIARDPRDRYDSAGELAEDLRRFIEDRPIAARRVSLVERFWRWRRRNRLVANLAVALALALVAGLSGTSWKWWDAERKKEQLGIARAAEVRLRLSAEHFADVAGNHAREAEQQRNLAEHSLQHARNAVEQYLTQISNNKLLNVPGLQPLRRDLLDSALAFFKEFIEQQGDDPRLRADLARAYRNVGEIIIEIGAAEDAIDAYRSALQTYEDLERVEPGAFLSKVAMCHSRLGTLYIATGRTAEALASFQTAIQLGDQLLLVDPQSHLLRDHLATHYANLAVLFTTLRNWSGALDACQKSESLARQLLAELPENRVFHRRLALALGNRGHLHVEMGSYHDALDAFRETASMRGQIADAYPDDLEARFEAASAQNSLGMTLTSLGDYEQAETHLLRAIALAQPLAEQNPELSDTRHLLAGAYSNLSVLDRNLGRTEQAQAHARTAIEVQARLAEEYSTVHAYQKFLASMHAGLADTLMMTGDVAGAVVEYHEEIDILRSLAESYPSISGYRHELAGSYNNLGLAYEQLHDPDATRKAYDEAVRLQHELVREQPADDQFQAYLGIMHGNLGHLYARLGQHDRAMEHHDQAIAIRERMIAQHDISAHRAALAEAFEYRSQAWGIALDLTRAVDDQRRSVEIRDELVQRFPRHMTYLTELSKGLIALANIDRDQSRSREALESYRRAETIAESLVADYSDVIQHREMLAGIWNNMGTAFEAAGQSDDAMAAHGRSLELRRKLRETYPDVVRFGDFVGDSLHNLGNVYKAQGQMDKAIANYQGAVDARRESIAAGIADFESYVDQANGYAQLGQCLIALGRLVDAEAAYQHAQVVQRQLIDRDPFENNHTLLAEILDRLSQLHKDLGRHESAEPLFTELIEMRRRQVQSSRTAETTHQLAGCLSNYGGLLIELDRLDEAISVLNEALECEQFAVNQHPQGKRFLEYLSNIKFNLACACAKTRDPEGALRHIDEVADMRDRLSADAPDKHKHTYEVASMRNSLGLILNENGQTAHGREQLETAAQSLDQLTQSYPHVNEYPAMLGGIYCNLTTMSQDPDQTIQWLDQAVTLLSRVVDRQADHAMAAGFLASTYWRRAMFRVDRQEYSDAAGDWNQAARYAREPQRAFIRSQHAWCLAKNGQTNRAMDEVQQIISTGPVTAWTVYTAARVFAVAAETARRQDSVDGEERMREVERLAQQSAALLRRAADAGLFRSPDNRSLVANEPDFKTLLDHPKFQGLLDDLRQ